MNVLKEYKHIGDLQSSSTLYMAVDKLPQVLKEKWWFYVDDKDEDWPDLIKFEKWLSRMAFVHEGFSAFKGERKEKDRRNTNREKQFSKTSNFSASSNLHYPWYPNSRERSVSVEGRDISPIAGRHYNTGHSSSSLPKMRLNNFDGNPLECNNPQVQTCNKPSKRKAISVH